MEVSCKRCHHKWNYKGKSVFYVTCPKCHIKNSVFLKENLKYAEKAICPVCGKEFYKKEKRSKNCSTHCFQVAAARQGNKILRERHGFRGKHNPNWRGGISKYHQQNHEAQERRYPERVKARRLLGYAVRDKKIIKPETCEHCKTRTKLHAHHEDYSKPLDVIWLCRPCHRKVHDGKH